MTDVDIRFDCTHCGRCCHNLKLPLSVDEAIAWAGRGHQVQVLTEALPAPSESPPEDPALRYRFDRAFAARCGDLAIGVNVTLVASYVGPCPNLGSDMRCSAYEARPRACRIYPAEVVAGLEVKPEAKACPPAAWDESRPYLVRDGAPASAETRRLIEEHRAVTLADAPAKARVCELLGVRTAALANEGYVVHSPSPDDMVAVLEAARPAKPGDAAPEWAIVSNRRQSVDRLRDLAAAGGLCASGDSYIGFFGDEA